MNVVKYVKELKIWRPCSFVRSVVVLFVTVIVKLLNQVEFFVSLAELINIDDFFNNIL
jgi:hypothetical protein